MAYTDKEIGKIDEYTIMHTEDYQTVCDKCCFGKICLKEEFCKCDSYSLGHNRDIYFIKK